MRSAATNWLAVGDRVFWSGDQDKDPGTILCIDGRWAWVKFRESVHCDYELDALVLLERGGVA